MFLQLFLQLPKYILRIYVVVRCFKLVPGILYGNYFPFCMQIFLQLLSSIFQRAEVWFKKHVLELFQYSSALFDNRIELISDLRAICRNDPVKHRSTTTRQIVKLPSNFMDCGACQTTSCTSFLATCQTTSCTSFSMLRKLLVKDRNFSLRNVWKYLALCVTKSLE